MVARLALSTLLLSLVTACDSQVSTPAARAPEAGGPADEDSTSGGDAGTSGGEPGEGEPVDTDADGDGFPDPPAPPAQPGDVEDVRGCAGDECLACGEWSLSWLPVAGATSYVVRWTDANGAAGTRLTADGEPSTLPFALIDGRVTVDCGLYGWQKCRDYDQILELDVSACFGPYLSEPCSARVPLAADQIPQWADFGTCEEEGTTGEPEEGATTGGDSTGEGGGTTGGDTTGTTSGDGGTSDGTTGGSTTSGAPEPDPIPEPITSILELHAEDHAPGTPVVLTGVVATSYMTGGKEGFYVQDPAGGPNTGAFVMTGASSPLAKPENVLTITGTYLNVKGADAVVVNLAGIVKTGTKGTPARVVVTAEDLALGGATIQGLESMMVSINLPTVSAVLPGAYELNGLALAEDFMFGPADSWPFATLGGQWLKVTGAVRRDGDAFTIAPRPDGGFCLANCKW